MFQYNFQKRLIAATPIISLIIFLTLGFVFDKWGVGALAFLLVPAMPVLLGMKSVKITYGLFVAVIYLILGFGFELWHPGWIIFLTIPVYEILVPSKKFIIITKTKKSTTTTIDME
ncbi:hypothetical protein [Acholeplasma hippikon]|uniref:Uncharacterized protein n=1 Tax=Acholeplasma hippikon TaxID=264636 RepID=A0A449BJI8_9MOLU|nr:hypothetical protein [Acholeplasma hippikon]VEU82612.1 Uncharacterised protein [Acholeplasma hippikon]